MDRLPSELIASIGCYCDPLSLLRLIACSKWLRTVLARSPLCWRAWQLRKVLVPSPAGATDANANAHAAAASDSSTSSLAIAAFYDTLVMRYLRCLDRRPPASLLVPSVVSSPTAGRFRLSWVSIGEILAAHVHVLDLSNTPIAFSVWDLVCAFPNIHTLNLAFCYHLRLGIPANPGSNDPDALSITAGTIVLKKLIKHCSTDVCPTSLSPATRRGSSRSDCAHRHAAGNDGHTAIHGSPFLPHLCTIRLRDTDVITSAMLAEINHGTRMHVTDVVECRTCGEIIPGAQTCRMFKCPRLVDICAACEDDSLNCDWSECESGAFLARICSACRPGLPQIPRAYNPPGYAADGSLVLNAPTIVERGVWSTASGQRLPTVKVPEMAFLAPGTSMAAADGVEGHLVALMPVCPDRLVYFYCPRHCRVFANCPVCYDKWACKGCGLGYCWECWNWNFVKQGELCWSCRSLGVAPPSTHVHSPSGSTGMVSAPAYSQQSMLLQATSSPPSSIPGSPLP